MAESKLYKVAVVGGGAAGLIGAIELCRDKTISGGDVVVLERNDRVGKKILATGNGRCNLTNENIGADNYHGDKSFINSFISTFNKTEFTDFMESLGVIITYENNGRGYPLSKQASAFLDIIRAHIAAFGIEVKTSFQVKNISFNNGEFIIESDGGKVRALNVIFACGGKSGEGLGTDGSAYSLIERFGHTVGELSPSIVQIKTEREKIKGLKNLKQNAKVSLIVNGKCVADSTGDLLFTDYGVSGNVAFYLSSYLNGENCRLKIDFLPEYDIDELTNILKKRKNMPFLKEEGEFVGIINKKIGYAVKRAAKSDTAYDHAYSLKNFMLNVLGTAPFTQSQVTKGGFSSDKINPFTFESKLIKNLYIVGEALDVDGDCGGYNLTFAFCSGIAAAKAIKSKKQ